MNGTPEMWTALNSLFVAVVAVLAFINNRRSAANSKAIEQVKESGREHTKAIKDVVDIVNGPLSKAIKGESEAKTRLAELTGDPQDIRSAQDAQAVQDARILGHTDPNHRSEG